KPKNRLLPFPFYLPVSSLALCFHAITNRGMGEVAANREARNLYASLKFELTGSLRCSSNSLNAPPGLLSRAAVQIVFLNAPCDHAVRCAAGDHRPRTQAGDSCRLPSLPRENASPHGLRPPR